MIGLTPAQRRYLTQLLALDPFGMSQTEWETIVIPLMHQGRVRLTPIPETLCPHPNAYWAAPTDFAVLALRVCPPEDA